MLAFLWNSCLSFLVTLSERSLSNSKAFSMSYWIKMASIIIFHNPKSFLPMTFSIHCSRCSSVSVLDLALILDVEVLSKFLNKLRSNTNLRRQRKTIPKIRKNITKQAKFIWFGFKIWILQPRIKITSKNLLRLNHFTPSRISENYQALSIVQWRRLTLWNPHFFVL